MATTAMKWKVEERDKEVEGCDVVMASSSAGSKDIES